MLRYMGPLSEFTAQLSRIIAANLPDALSPRTIAVTLVLAIGIFILRRGQGAKGADGRSRQMSFWQFLLPQDIYRHLSFRVDIWLWILERALRPVLFTALLLSLGPVTEASVLGAATAWFGASPALTPHYAWMLLYSLVLVLCYDLVFYGIHYAMHKVPALWAIHQVHHSAEVLTPLTRTREHFLAGPIWAAGAAIGYAVPGALFAYLFDGALNQATLLGIGVFALLFGLTGNFRHYHVALHYPRWLSRWLQSPAMHHTHHSYLPQHLDTNLAAVTSIYDRLFGTLYIPAKDEYTPWGLGPSAQPACRTFWQNTLAPFRTWKEMRSRSASNSSQAPAAREAQDRSGP